jgi:Na+/alanine symporter
MDINVPLTLACVVFAASSYAVWYVLNNFDVWFLVKSDAITTAGYAVLIALCCLAGGTLTLATYYGLQGLWK